MGLFHRFAGLQHVHRFADECDFRSVLRQRRFSKAAFTDVAGRSVHKAIVSGFVPAQPMVGSVLGAITVVECNRVAVLQCLDLSQRRFNVFRMDKVRVGFHPHLFIAVSEVAFPG